MPAPAPIAWAAPAGAKARRRPPAAAARPGTRPPVRRAPRPATSPARWIRTSTRRPTISRTNSSSATRTRTAPRKRKLPRKRSPMKWCARPRHCPATCRSTRPTAPTSAKKIRRARPEWIDPAPRGAGSQNHKRGGSGR
ncbi:hypothetical protein CBM2633_B10144 [Cupriavidus taiwanensis]|nr:hypothetical protein CBM2633_B10144 [Cupriavidus taiwanensis]